MVKDEWEKERMKRDRINSEVLQEFIQEYSEMFDVTSETARKMQTVYWAYRNEFNKGD